MKIVKLKGGLGNQIFQYCFAKLIEQKTREEVKLDFSEYDLINDPIRKPRILKFAIDLPSVDKSDLKKVCMIEHNGGRGKFSYRLKIAFEAKFNKKYYFEPNRAYKDVGEIINYSYFDGYWQSWRYVDSIWDDVKVHLIPRFEINENVKADIDEVTTKANSVFVGIRRGDYLQTKPDHYGSFGMEYYRAAMEKMTEMVKNPIFYIFSNDIEWVKKNMDFNEFHVKYRDKIYDDFDEFLVMSNCRNAIIPNSTYHWWGARLNYTQNKKVIAPKRWFQDDKPIDIVPNSWIRL